MTTQQHEAPHIADALDAVPETGADPDLIQAAAAELRRLYAQVEALTAAQPSPAPAPTLPDLGTLTGLAKQYADSYASPHHFTLGVNGLRQIIQRCSPQPVQDGEIPESVIDAVAAAEIRKSMQGGQHVE